MKVGDFYLEIEIVKRQGGKSLRLMATSEKYATAITSKVYPLDHNFTHEMFEELSAGIGINLMEYVLSKTNIELVIVIGDMEYTDLEMKVESYRQS